MRIALNQIVAGPDPEQNLELVERGVAKSADLGADLAVFPEATMACFGVKLAPIAQRLQGPWPTAVRKMAESAGIAVVAGMFTPAAEGRVYNTLLVAGRGLDIFYDKIHLFDAFGFQESRTVAPGEGPLTVEVDGVTVGITTCYDIRFPWLYTTLADRGASVILVSASWGSGPGKREQWETLVRARAMDSTCWLLACGQADPRTVGVEPKTTAPTGIGYSTAATPLGEIHAQLDAEPDILVVDVDQETVDTARKNLPVLANRRG